MAVKTEAADRIGELIDEHSDFEILSKSAGAGQLTEQVKSLAPDIIIIDIELPGFDWVSAVYETKNLHKKPGVAVLASSSDSADLLSAFREGADAYILKGSLQEDLIPALMTVKNNRIFLKKKNAEAIRNHMQYLELGSARNVAEVKNGISKLTVREKEVFPLLADGKSIKDVAKTLGISPKTVETHKYHIIEKLNLQTMADLTKLAIIKDLIPL